MSVRGDRQFAAILLSRQSRRPSRKEDWVTHTEQAVCFAAKQEFGIISSVGMLTWELITSLAVLHRLPLRLLIPPDRFESDSTALDRLAAGFELDLTRTEIVWLRGSGESGKVSRMSSRDREIVSKANVLFPISIRPRGSMAALIESARKGGTTVDIRFEISYERHRTPLKYNIDCGRLNPELAGIKQQYLVHWTRGVNGPWPGERPVDYYREILASELCRRTALDSLQRILSMKRILGSSRHMPLGIPTVAFSGLLPRDVVPLMRWRARYGEMSFEPYGIGIDRDSVDRLGIYPVQYVSNSAPGDNDETVWLRQSIGAKTDWRQENEFRCRGDVDLAHLSPEELIVFCLLPEEAADINRQFGIRAVSFY